MAEWELKETLRRRGRCWIPARHGVHNPENPTQCSCLPATVLGSASTQGALQGSGTQLPLCFVGKSPPLAIVELAPQREVPWKSHRNCEILFRFLEAEPGPD